ncbi:MAG: PP2C family protein-serine/threonine phosphatase [Hyphomicrobiaceae bacterium]
MPQFDSACRASQGARSYQEDSALLFPRGAGAAAPAVTLREATSEGLVAVLADGMGGHVGGALASRLVCERFVATCAAENGPVRQRLLRGLAAANRAVAEHVAENPMLSGMGSTMVGAHFGEDGVEWVSVGDSPLLLYRAGEIALLNEDHSLAPELDRLVAAGHMTEDEARHDSRRHMLRSAVTGDEIDLVDISVKPLRLQPGDYVILASDGLNTIENPEIARVVSAYAADGPGAVAAALIRAVENMREPHQDNVTVVAVRIRPEA